jgi:hypothetical protein
VQPGAQAHFVGINEHISLLLSAAARPRCFWMWAAARHRRLFDHRFLNKTVARLLREHPQLLAQGRSLLANQGNHPLFSRPWRGALASGIRVAPPMCWPPPAIRGGEPGAGGRGPPGDMVAVESPTYYGLLQVVESLQLQTLEIPCPRTGMSIEALELAFQTQPRLKAVVVVPELQMPLGARMPDAHKARLVALCARPGGADRGRFLWPVCRRQPAGQAAEGLGQRVRPCDLLPGLQQSLAPGLRQGWMNGGLAWPDADAEICPEPQHPDPGAAGGGRGAGLTRAPAQPGAASAQLKPSAKPWPGWWHATFPWARA